MPKRYSPEIRRTALELVNQGQTQIEVAQALGVSPKTLSHWVTTTQARMPDQQLSDASVNFHFDATRSFHLKIGKIK